jgi:hypothetical protein
VSRLHRWISLLAAAGTLTACGSGGAPTNPGPGGDTLPARPELVTPAAGELVATDTPTFTIRNAQGFDGSGTEYTFEVVTAGAQTVLARAAVPGGSRTTTATVGPLPRGMDVAWRVTGRNGVSDTTSETRGFRLPPVDCPPLRDPFAKAVVDAFLTECSRARNSYNDPREVLGPPDAGGTPARFHGFMSLGEGGHVIVDMGGCAANGTLADVRVYQTVSSEPVTLYAGGTPTGPWRLLEARKRCGDRLPGLRSGYCDFDLGEMSEARYFKIEDGELFPCDRAGTDSEGADIDAIEILNAR